MNSNAGHPGSTRGDAGDIIPFGELAVIFDGRLRKRVLMSLPEGLFLVSNVYATPDRPVFAGYLSAAAARAEQWRALVRLGVDGRRVRVFRRREDCESWLRRWSEGYRCAAEGVN